MGKANKKCNKEGKILGPEQVQDILTKVNDLDKVSEILRNDRWLTCHGTIMVREILKLFGSGHETQMLIKGFESEHRSHICMIFFDFNDPEDDEWVAEILKGMSSLKRKDMFDSWNKDFTAEQETFRFVE